MASAPMDNTAAASYVAVCEAFWGISYTVNEAREGFPGCFFPVAFLASLQPAVAYSEAGGMEREPCRETQRDDGALPGVSRDNPPHHPATDSPPNVDIHGASQEIGSQMLPFPARVPPSDVN